MSWFDNLVGKRESEFTGLKGAILRYAGNAYTLVLVGLFFLAFAEAYPAAARAPAHSRWHLLRARSDHPSSQDMAARPPERRRLARVIYRAAVTA